MPTETIEQEKITPNAEDELFDSTSSMLPLIPLRHACDVVRETMTQEYKLADQRL